MLACWQTRSPAATAQHTAYSTQHAARSQHTHTQHTHCTAGSTAKSMFQVSAALAGIQKGPPGGPGGLWGHIWSLKRAPVFKLAKAQFHQILDHFWDPWGPFGPQPKALIEFLRLWLGSKSPPPPRGHCWAPQIIRLLPCRARSGLTFGVPWRVLGPLWGHIWSLKRAQVFNVVKAQFHQILDHF
jgi:hypothetical protein